MAIVCLEGRNNVLLQQRRQRRIHGLALPTRGDELLIRNAHQTLNKLRATHHLRYLHLLSHPVLLASQRFGELNLYHVGLKVLGVHHIAQLQKVRVGRLAQAEVLSLLLHRY